MPVRPPRGLPIVSVALAGLALGLAAVGRGEPPRSPLVQDAKAAPTPAWATAVSCNLCHRESTAGRQPITDFVSLKEFDIWSEKDKHKDAFTKLGSDRSKEMGKRLGYDVTTSNECLSCHAPAALAPEKDREAIAEGVSCVSCHGAFSNWVTEHHGVGKPNARKAQEDWIKKPAREKHDQYGMNDLRDPAERSKVCASCHVGDASQGRVVTHSMYAAGHPPLPGLEVATFSEAEPPHWWPMKNVPYLNQSDDALIKKYGEQEGRIRIITQAVLRENYKVDEFPTQHAKLVAVGGVVAFRDAMNLFADTASDKDGKPTLDFARFDCASCHHELAESKDSFRQRRGFASDPGRPPAPDWPSALVSIGIVAANPAKIEARKNEVASGLKTFHAAVGKRPFGDPVDAILQARAMSRWADGLIKELDSSRLDRTAAIRMLAQITEIVPPDHASARQLVWGFKAIYDELDPRPSNDKAIKDTIAQLETLLGIKLTPGKQGAIEMEVGQRLEGDDRFNPDAVGKLFDTLGALLK